VFPRRVIILSALLFLVVCAVFAPGVTDGHLFLDDYGYTAGCPFVKDGLSRDGFKAAFTTVGWGGIWMPLTSLSYALDVSLFGGGWYVHHAVNVALHALVSVLLFLLVLKAFSRLVLSSKSSYSGPENQTIKQSNNQTIFNHFLLFCLFSVLFWALHPMRAEAVVWIASRKEILWSFFALAALGTWHMFLEKGGGVRYLFTLALFVCALLSKPTAVAFPLIAFLYDRLFFNRRTRTADHQPPIAHYRSLAVYLPFFALASAVIVVSWSAQAHPVGCAPVDIADTPFGWRVLNALVSFGMYVFRTFVPFDVHIDYRAVFGGWPLEMGTGLAVLALAAAGWVYVLRRLQGTPFARMWVFSSVAALFAVAPVMGLAGVTGDKAYADRYTYLPAAFFTLPLACGLAYAATRKSFAFIRNASFALLVLTVVFLSPVVASLHDDASAWKRVLRFDPGHWRALRVVGSTYCAREGRMDEGLAMLRRSLEARPAFATASALAYALACRNAPGDAEEVLHLGASALADPSLDREGLMLDALGLALTARGEKERAEACFRASLAAPFRSHGKRGE